MLAVRRRREPGTWAFFGAILGPAALALLRVAPPGRCWSCAAPTEGWLTLCPWCGEDIREPVRRIPEPVRQIAETVRKEEVRTHGPLTVIEGTAPREPARRPEARDTIGPASTNGAATVRTEPVVLDLRAVDPVPRERRIDLAPQPPLAEQARRMPAAIAAAAAAAVEPAADPVRRLKASLGRSTQSLGAATARVPAQVAEPAAAPQSVVLASAIYVTGSRGLLAGSRYGIALLGDDLRILGPVDVDPGAVAIHHSIRGMDATGLQGRLIITATDGRRDQLALVFMSVAGGSPEGVADAIIAAAAELRADSR